MSEAAIKDAMDAAHQFLSDTAQRRAYVNRLMAVLDYNSGMENAREEGREEGIEEGEKRGVEKGRREGENMGIKKTTDRFVVSLLQDNMPLKKIVQWTKLTEETVRQIAKENGIEI